MTYSKILITGGAGFIGSSLTMQLLALNKEIAIVDNLSTGRRALVPNSSSVTFFKGDIQDKLFLKKCFSKFKPEVVIHLAAIHFIPYCNAHPSEVVDVNIMGTSNILEISSQFNVKKIIFASSASVYKPQETAHKEIDDVSPMDIYGKSKLIGEWLCQLYSNRSKTPIVIARFFNVYGHNETNPHLIPEIQSQLELNPKQIILGNTETKRDYIHVDDVCKALISVINLNIFALEIFNVGTGKEYSARELIKVIQKIKKHPIIIQSDKRKWRVSDRPHLLANNQKIIQKTDWRPQISIEQGLEKLLA